MFHTLKINLLFPILVLGLWSCVTRPTGDTRQTKPADPNWTPEIQQRVAQFQKHSLPWGEEAPELANLRRELFQLRHRLLKAGEDIELQAPLYRKRIENLELDVRAPETHLVGEPLVLDISFLDDTNGNEADEPPWFSATLTNTSDRPIRIIPANGVLVFPDAVTGRELEMWPRMEGQAEPPPRYRPYLTSIEIITLRPGEEYTRRVTPRETYQPWERRLTHWREALAEGRQYEVQWHYTIPPAWFVEDGQFQTVNSWIGRLASNSVTYTRQPRPPSQPAE